MRHDRYRLRITWNEISTVMQLNIFHRIMKAVASVTKAILLDPVELCRGYET